MIAPFPTNICQRISTHLLCFVVTVSCFSSVLADGPADNRSDSVRPIPPPGREVPKDKQATLKNGCFEIRDRWQKLIDKQQAVVTSTPNKWAKQNQQQRLTELKTLTPEVLVFPRAIELALELNQFYKPQEIESAQQLLDEARARIERANEDTSWNHVVGLINGSLQQLLVGGYQSRIDQSFQPYAVVVPAGFTAGDSRPRRLDLWFHGRGETLSEVNFLQKGRSNAGEFTPADTFVLHPYGRYSNAFKFAGEIDVLESLQYLESRLPVDSDRIAVRGFSMGGAGCWQFATHYADRFFAANPGAGFSETPEFLKSFQGEDVSASPDFQRTLWQWYDCPPWSRNLIHCPTVAYSGEIDRQKQAADVMEVSLAKHAIDLLHIIGPQTAHKLHADSKIEIENRLAHLARTTSSATPTSIDFTTCFLRYHRMHWIDVRGLKKQWSLANVQATLNANDQTINIQTNGNATGLRLDFTAGQWPGSLPATPRITIDGQVIQPEARVASDRSFFCEIHVQSGVWQVVRNAENRSSPTLAKRPGLQGPIDDAFMDSFLFVAPSTTSGDAADRWATDEFNHAKVHWRKHFRGDIQSKLDNKLTPDEIEDHHLVAFGDPDSNTLIARLQDELPILWTENEIQVGDQKFDRKTHTVAFIYPNPLNSNRYLVVNSGFTFREYDYLNNARQTPKLPDWAVFNLNEPVSPRSPGKIVAAGFFNEQWQVK